MPKKIKCKAHCQSSMLQVVILLLCSSLYSYSLAGVSRSVTLVVAYIMTVTGLGWQEALAAVKVVRPCAGPNLGFQRQLQEFETMQADQVTNLGDW